MLDNGATTWSKGGFDPPRAWGVTVAAMSGVRVGGAVVGNGTRVATVSVAGSILRKVEVGLGSGVIVHALDMPRTSAAIRKRASRIFGFMAQHKIKCLPRDRHSSRAL